MSIRHNKLTEISEKDLLSLISDEIREGKEIEYKENLPGDSPEEKAEFLADVSSFANTAGGDLVFGLMEKRDEQGRPTGLPGEIPGIAATNLDAVTLRLENIMRDGLQPRVMGISVHPILLSNVNHALIVRVPRSWAAPHTVTYRGSSKFYARNSAGKYQLDVGEIKAAFLRNETVVQRLRDFRADRIAKLIANEGPLPTGETAKIVLHLVPLGAFDAGFQFDVNLIAMNSADLEPMYSSSWSHRLNFDGLLSYSGISADPKCYNYLQIFRNGCIEAVDNLLLEPHNNQLLIPSIAFEKEILEATPRFLNLQRKLGVDPPIVLMLTLLGVLAYQMAVNTARFRFAQSQPVDRDSLIIPEVIVEDFDCDIEQLVRPCFDIIWNAAGWPKSINYDNSGKWVGH